MRHNDLVEENIKLRNENYELREQVNRCRTTIEILLKNLNDRKWWQFWIKPADLNKKLFSNSKLEFATESANNDQQLEK